MYGTKLCMGTKKHFEAPVEQQIELYHQAGFEGFFTEWDDNIPLYRETADRLIATHLNDNYGVSDYGGVITPTDDHHLLPFDGIFLFLFPKKGGIMALL